MSRGGGGRGERKKGREEWLGRLAKVTFSQCVITQASALKQKIGKIKQRGENEEPEATVFARDVTMKAALVTSRQTRPHARSTDLYKCEGMKSHVI